jgi:hypothetical protein
MEFQRGLVRSYDPTTHTAAVLLVGSMSRVLLSLPVSHHIGPELMVEGAACGVAFFAEGSQGVVVCTFDGAPAPWITPSLLTFSPCTPEGWSDGSITNQELTTTATTYSTLSHEIEVPTGKTYRVLLIGNVEMGCSAYTNYNYDIAATYKGSNGWGTYQDLRINAVNDRASVTVAQQGTTSATNTFAIKVWKSLDRNTEVCYRGHMTLLWWEDAS